MGSAAAKVTNTLWIIRLTRWSTKDAMFSWNLMYVPNEVQSEGHFFNIRYGFVVKYLLFILDTSALYLTYCLIRVCLIASHLKICRSIHKFRWNHFNEPSFNFSECNHHPPPTNIAYYSVFRKFTHVKGTFFRVSRRQSFGDLSLNCFLGRRSLPLGLSLLVVGWYSNGDKCKCGIWLEAMFQV